MRTNIAARVEQLRKRKLAAAQGQENTDASFQTQETQGSQGLPQDAEFKGEQADDSGAEHRGSGEDDERGQDQWGQTSDQDSEHLALEGQRSHSLPVSPGQGASGRAARESSVGLSSVRPGTADTLFGEGEASEEQIEQDAALRERERELILKEREIQAEALRLDQEARAEELHLRSSSRKMGLGLAIPSLKLARTLGLVADEIERKVRSNITSMSLRDLKAVAEMTVNVADKTSRIVRNAYDMEREARGSVPGGIGSPEEYSTPEEALEALEELANTVDRYGDGVIAEDEFPESSVLGTSGANNLETEDL